MKSLSHTHARRCRTSRWAYAIPAALLVVYAAQASAGSGSFDANGVPVHYTDQGSGEAVIYLHGFAGSSAMWSEVGLMPLEGFRTLSYDARGHGISGKPLDAEAYGEELVDDVIRLMDDRGIGAAHLVGYSMGAETALALVTHYPDRVLSVVAAGSGWSGDEEAEAYGFIAGALTEAENFAGFMGAMAPADEEMPPEAAEMMMALLAAHGIDPMQPAAPLAAVSASLPEIISISATELAEVDVPVLGIAGELDPERANVEALAGAITGFQLEIIPEADHLTAPVSPQFAAAVTSFLQQ